MRAARASAVDPVGRARDLAGAVAEEGHVEAWSTAMKIASTVRSWLIVTSQVGALPASAQSPPHPANAEPASGVAVRGATVSEDRSAAQIVGQSMPPTSASTRPPPVPERLTESGCSAMNVAVAARSESRTMPQEPGSRAVSGPSGEDGADRGDRRERDRGALLHGTGCRCPDRRSRPDRPRPCPTRRPRGPPPAGGRWGRRWPSRSAGRSSSPGRSPCPGRPTRPCRSIPRTSSWDPASR